MPLNVVVAGAGIAGLATAVAFAKHGHHVTIFEKRRYEDREESGSSIQLQPNAMNILRAWDMYEDLIKVAHDNEAAELRRYDTAKTIAIDYSTAKGGAYLGLRRDVRDVFRMAATRYGVTLEDGKRVMSVDSKGPTVSFDDGTSLDADLVIGADGSFSKVRHSLFPAYRAQIQSHCFYQVVLPLEEVESDPETRDLLSGPRNVVWCAPERNIFSTPVFTRKLYDIQLCDSQAVLEHDPEPETRSGRMTDIDFVRKRFADHHVSMRKALEKANSYWKWRLVEVTGVPSWSNPNGKVILAGDSVHSMRPYSGQGSAMGIEDGAVLGELFSKSKPGDDFSKIAQLYEKLRRPRCEKIHQLATAQGEAWTASSPQVQERRDKALVSNANPNYDSVTSDPEASFASAPFRKWLNEYDVFAECHKAMHDSDLIRAKI